MKRAILALSLFIPVTLFNSCATIVSKSSWPVHVNCKPDGANVTITNRRGETVYKGTTPVMLSLRSGAGFFKKERYLAHFEFDGYAAQDVPLECKLNGWYFGNLFIGGLLGLLIIDPATGAMYKVETPFLDARLEQKETSKSGTVPELKIADIRDVPPSVAKNLVRIN